MAIIMNTSYRIALPEQLSGYLKTLRKQAGLTQQQLGERLGMSQRMVAKLEAHPERSSFERVLAVFAVLGADFVVQLRGTGAPSRDREDSPSIHSAGAQTNEGDQW